MANNYCQSSNFITVPAAKLKQAQQIIEKIEDKLESSSDGYVGFEAKIEKNGVWIHDDESITPTHVELLVRTLVEELNLPGIYICSWAYTCSKPRINEFGGGAFAIQKRCNTVWIDAAIEAKHKILQMSNNQAQL